MLIYKWMNEMWRIKVKVKIPKELGMCFYCFAKTSIRVGIFKKIQIFITLEITTKLSDNEEARTEVLERGNPYFQGFLERSIGNSLEVNTMEKTNSYISNEVSN